MIRLEALALFDRDNAVLSDFLNRVRDQSADFRVVARNAGDAGDLLLVALHFDSHLLQFGNSRVNSGLDAFF